MYYFTLHQRNIFCNFCKKKTANLKIIIPLNTVLNVSLTFCTTPDFRHLVYFERLSGKSPTILNPFFLCESLRLLQSFSLVTFSTLL